MQMEASGAMQVRDTKREYARRGLRQRGVILIETLVGIAVISTTVLVGLMALSTASIATQQVSDGSTAGWIIVSQVERINTENYVSTIGTNVYPTPDISSAPGFTVQNVTSTYPVLAGTPTPSPAGIQVVTITVSKGGEVVGEKQIVKVNR
jgi:hypothetical protein